MRKPRRAKLLALNFGGLVGGVLSLVILLAGSAQAAPPFSGQDQLAPRYFPAPERFAQQRFVSHPPQGAIALTFDDGPAQDVTPLILGELQRQNVRATFFVTAQRIVGSGAAAQERRRLVLEEAAAGHDVGSHGLAHRRLTDLAISEQLSEISVAQKALEKLLGERVLLYRPAYGRLTEAAKQYLARQGVAVVLWKASGDDPYIHEPDKVVAHLMEELIRADGGIVLLHDTHPWTAQALPLFFSAIASENHKRQSAGLPLFTFTTLDHFLHPRYALAAPTAADKQTAKEKLGSGGEPNNHSSVTSR